MKKADALNYFGDIKNVANLLGLTLHAIYQWPDKVPERCQWQLALMSDLELMPEEKLIPPGLSIQTLKAGNEGDNRRISELMRIVRLIDQQGKTDIIDALITMAKHTV